MLSVIDAYETFETGGYGFIATPGQTIGEVLENSGIVSVEPVLEGDEFEGWMEVTVAVTVDEDGFEWQEYSLIPDAIYTTEELLALTIPECSVMYVAKWASTPAEDYYAPYEAETIVMSSITLLTGEGVMVKNSEEGPYEAAMSVATVEPGQTFGEVLELDAIAAMNAEGKLFAGWTVYEYNTDAMETSETCVEEEGVLCFEVFEDYHMVLREYTLCYELISTEELAEIVCEETDHVVIAGWMTAEEYVSFIKEQADTIKVSLEQDELTQTDMNMKSEELRALWDRTLNLLLDEAKNELAETEMEQLAAEQSAWTADTETAIEAAGKEFEGGSMYALIVNSEAARLTEERVFQLFELLK